METTLVHQHARLGQGDLTAIVQNVVNQVVEAALPALKEAVAASAQAAEPVIQKIVDESIMPKVTLGIVVGMVGVAGISALIGSFFATRGGSKGSKMSGLGVENLAARDGLSSGHSLGGLKMTQSVNSPPVRAKAANGNLVHELRQSARELADELARKRSEMAGSYRPGSPYRPGYMPMNPGTGLGLSRMLVHGDVNPGALVGGGFLGVVAHAGLSRIVLQQGFGTSPMVGDGIVGGAGLILHLLARSSLTLGVAFTTVFPFVVDLVNAGLKAVGVEKAIMAGAQQQAPQRVGTTVTPAPQRSVAELRRQLVPQR